MAFPRWTEEHDAFRASVRRFAEQEIRPFAEKWQAEGYFPDALFRKAGELGLLGVRFDPRWGGSGLDYWYTVLLVEELVRGRDLGCVVGLMVQCEMATAVIHDHGSDALRQEWLVPAIRGERIAALGVSEPGGGSDVASLQTTARVDGDDYVIRGSKIFISNGARADFVTLAVRTGGPGPNGVSLVVCPTDAKGFQVSRRLQKVDLHSSDTAECFFDDVRSSRRHRIGEDGQGSRSIRGAFQRERLVRSVMRNAPCDGVLADLAERKAFGRPRGGFLAESGWPSVLTRNPLPTAREAASGRLHLVRETPSPSPISSSFRIRTGTASGTGPTRRSGSVSWRWWIRCSTCSSAMRASGTSRSTGRRSCSTTISPCAPARASGSRSWSNRVVC